MNSDVARERKSGTAPLLRSQFSFDVVLFNFTWLINCFDVYHSTTLQFFLLGTSLNELCV